MTEMESNIRLLAKAKRIIQVSENIKSVRGFISVVTSELVEELHSLLCQQSYLLY